MVWELVVDPKESLLQLVGKLHTVLSREKGGVNEGEKELVFLFSFIYLLLQLLFLCF